MRNIEVFFWGEVASKEYPVLPITTRTIQVQSVFSTCAFIYAVFFFSCVRLSPAQRVLVRRCWQRRTSPFIGKPIAAACSTSTAKLTLHFLCPLE